MSFINNSDYNLIESQSSLHHVEHKPQMLIKGRTNIHYNYNIQHKIYICCHGWFCCGSTSYLWANEDTVLVVGAVSTNEKRVRSYLLEQVETSPHDLVHAPTRLLRTVGREAVGGRGSPWWGDSATLKLHGNNRTSIKLMSAGHKAVTQAKTGVLLGGRVTPHSLHALCIRIDVSGVWHRLEWWNILILPWKLINATLWKKTHLQKRQYKTIFFSN